MKRDKAHINKIISEKRKLTSQNYNWHQRNTKGNKKLPQKNYVNKLYNAEEMNIF